MRTTGHSYSYSYSYGQGPSRTRHLVVRVLAAALLLALVVVVVSAVGLLTGGNDAQGNARTDSPSTQGDGPGTGGSAGESMGEYESDPVTGLPIGSSAQDGRPTGFPRTDLGAAAVVVDLNRAQIGLDVDTALTTIGVYADPADQAFFGELATASIAQRRNDLGAPAAGEVDAPAAYAQSPIGYQVEQYPTEPADQSGDETDLYLVSVLNEVTTTTTAGESGRSFYVGQQFVAWTPDDGGGDWKLVEPTEATREQLLATAPPTAAVPGTREFDQAGWIALVDQPTDQTSDESAEKGAPPW